MKEINLDAMVKLNSDQWNWILRETKNETVRTKLLTAFYRQEYPTFFEVAMAMQFVTYQWDNSEWAEKMIDFTAAMHKEYFSKEG